MGDQISNMSETNNAQVAQSSLEHNRYGPRFAGPGPQVGGYGAAYGGYGHPGAHQSYGYGHPGQTVHGGVQQVYGGVQSVVQSPELIQAREKSQAMWAEVNSKRGNSGAYSAAGHHGGYAAAHSGYAGAHGGYAGSASRFGGHGYGHPAMGHGYGHPAMGHPGFGGFGAAPA